MRYLPLLFILELFVGITMTHYFGFLNTFLVYFVPTFLGLTFFGLQNQMIWMQFQRQMASGKTPDNQLLQLLAKFIGTLLMIVPSLLCRVGALFLLFPLTRYLFVGIGRVWITKKITDGSFRVFSGKPGFGAGNHNFRTYGFGDDFAASQGPREERDAKVIDIEALPLPGDKT